MALMTSQSPDSVGARYASTRARLTDLLSGLTEAEWAAPVPACPGWRVRDVLAHLVGNLEDGAAGRISGPPSPAQTDEQLARHRDDDPAELLATWGVAAELAEPVLTEGEAWPAFIDVLSHEHDVRGALGRPGAREDDDLVLAARLVSGAIEVGDGRRIELDLASGAPSDSGSGSDPDAYVVSLSPFEALRLRLGRRSLEQARALPWSQDPSSVLPHLFIFGPRTEPLVE